MAKLVADFEYTDAELLALYRQAVAKLSFAQSYEINGETYTRASIPDLLKMIAALEARISAAASRQTHNYGRLVRV